MKTLISASTLAILALASPALAEKAGEASAVSEPSVAAPTGQYASDPGHTSLHWKIGHMGLSNYTARMSDVSINLDFDASDIESSSVRAVIIPASVDTGFEGDKDFNGEIASPMILNAEAHPKIKFVSTKIERTGANTADVTGDLTLLGVTKPVTLSATYNGSMASHPFVKVPAIGFSAIGTFDRTEFGVGFLSGQGLADEVEIVIQTELLKQEG